MGSESQRTAVPRPSIFLGWANKQAHSFCLSFAYWFAAVFPDLDLLVSVGEDDDIGPDLDLKLAVLVMTERSRGRNWLQYQAGLLEQRLGRDHVVRLTLGLEEQHRATGPLARYKSYDLRPGSMRRLCELMGASAGQTWRDQQSLAFRNGYSAVTDEFREIFQPGSSKAKVEPDVKYYMLPETPSIAIKQQSLDSVVPSGRRGVGTLLHALRDREPGLEYLIERGAIATMLQPAGADRPGPVYLPVSVYVSGSDLDPQRITTLVDALLDAFDLELVAELPPVYGSVLAQFLARTRELVTVKEVEALLVSVDETMKEGVARIRRAVELKGNEWRSSMSIDAPHREPSGDDDEAEQLCRDLADLLATVASDADTARLIARRAGFRPQHLPEFKTAAGFWDYVVDKALNGWIPVEALIAEAASQFPHNLRLREYTEVIGEELDHVAEDPERVRAVPRFRKWLQHHRPPEPRVRAVSALMSEVSQYDKGLVVVGPETFVAEAGKYPVAGTLTTEQMVRISRHSKLPTDPEVWAVLPKPEAPPVSDADARPPRSGGDHQE